MKKMMEDVSVLEYIMFLSRHIIGRSFIMYSCPPRRHMHDPGNIVGMFVRAQVQGLHGFYTRKKLP